jgi:hypothetical protein
MLPALILPAVPRRRFTLNRFHAPLRWSQGVQEALKNATNVTRLSVLASGRCHRPLAYRQFLSNGLEGTTVNRAFRRGAWVLARRCVLTDFGCFFLRLDQASCLINPASHVG